MLQSLLEHSRPVDKRPRLSEAVSGRTAASLHSLTTLSSNIESIEAGMRFAGGTEPFVAVYGPSGWGKSHLLIAVSETMGVPVQSAFAWLKQAKRGPDQGPIILDDIQDVLSHPRSRHHFKQLVEFRLRTGKPTLLACSMVGGSSQLSAMLPCPGAWVMSQLREPGVGDRAQVVIQIAQRVGLQLSWTTVKLIARHLHGNGRSIAGALQRLRLDRSDWSRPEDVIPACGVLSPYLMGHEGWDPRDHVFEAVVRTIGPVTTVFNASEVACFLMLDDMGLSEGEVAAFMGVSPSTVYGQALMVRRRLSEPEAARLVDACRSAVLLGFEED
ncbi:MAG: hypothetical protein JST30_15220 [Armatimonadetes bacterium]|nr:hypothetical protein [Armatimonadota bacterium]